MTTRGIIAVLKNQNTWVGSFYASDAYPSKVGKIVWDEVQYAKKIGATKDLISFIKSGDFFGHRGRYPPVSSEMFDPEKSMIPSIRYYIDYVYILNQDLTKMRIWVRQRTWVIIKEIDFELQEPEWEALPGLHMGD